MQADETDGDCRCPEKGPTLAAGVLTSVTVSRQYDNDNDDSDVRVHELDVSSQPGGLELDDAVPSMPARFVDRVLTASDVRHVDLIRNTPSVMSDSSEGGFQEKQAQNHAQLTCTDSSSCIPICK